MIDFKMHKNFKRILSAVISASLLIASVIPIMGITANAEDKKLYDKTTVIDQIDGKTSDNNKFLYVGGKEYECTEDNSLYPVNITGTPLAKMNGDSEIDELCSSEKYSVSFDIMVPADVQISTKLTTIWLFSKETLVNPNNSQQKENKGRLGSITVYADKLILSGDGSTGNNTTVSITKGEWVNIDFVVYPKKDENDKNETNWYINGELKATGNINWASLWYISQNRKFNQIVPTDTQPKSVYFRNFKVAKIESVDETYTYNASAFVDEESSINVNFSKDVPNDSKIGSIKVYDKGGDELSCSIEVVSDSELKIIPVQKSDSYTIKFPDRFISKDGYSLLESSISADGFEQVKLVNSSGDTFSVESDDKAYASAKLLNTSDKDRTLSIILVAYKCASNGLEMIDFSKKSVIIPSNGVLAISPTGENSIELNVPGDARVIKAFMWDEDEYNKPLKDVTEVFDQQYEKKVPDTDGFNQTAASELSILTDFGESNKNERASLYITDKENNCVYSDQLITDSNGRVGTYIELADDFDTGEYYAEVSIGKEHKNFSISYVNAQKYDAAASKINAEIDNSALAKDKAIKNISDLLDENYSYFGIDENLFSSVNSDEIAVVVYNELSMGDNTRLPLFGENSFENMEAGSRMIKRFYIICACGNGKISNLFDYSGELELKDDENYEWYTKEYVTESVQKDITSRMSKENLNTSNYETQKAFYKQLKDSYILAIVKAPNGEDNLREVLKNFASYIGIKDNLKSSTLTSLKGMNLKTVDGENGLKGVIEDLEKNNSGSSSQTGGGTRTGGSTGKSSSMSFDNTISQKEEPEIIPSDIFVDLGGYDWAKQAITYLAERRIVNGKSEETFCPSDFITREEFAAMLVRAFAADAEKADIDFSDVDENEWYYDSLRMAKSAGIISGYENGKFGIGENISRQDMVTMACRAAKFSGIMLSVDGGYTPFDDDTSISDYAKESVYELKNAEIVNGVSDRMFAPLENAERAQAAKVIFELLNV